jgi:hypothetical protein
MAVVALPTLRWIPQANALAWPNLPEVRRPFVVIAITPL